MGGSHEFLQKFGVEVNKTKRGDTSDYEIFLLHLFDYFPLVSGG